MRLTLAKAAALVAVAALPLIDVAPAAAATVGASPVAGSWGPHKACSGKPRLNCAAVYAIQRIGNTTYIGGDFTSLKSSDGTSTKTIKNLAALDANGRPVASFASPGFNATIRALASDGTRLFAGGSFTRVGGATARHLAAFTPTGRRITPFGSGVNTKVRALAYASGALYTGAASIKKLNAANGTVNNAFHAPTLGTTSGAGSPYVWSLAPTGSQLYVGGHFNSVGGRPHLSVARLNASSGAVDNSFTPTISTKSAADPLLGVADLAVTSDGVVAAQEGHTNRAYRWGPTGGARWRFSPDGDAQSVTIDGGTVYIGGHFEYVGTTPRQHIAAVSLSTGALDRSWAPSMGASYSPYYYGVWVVRMVNGSLWAGGVFNNVNGRPVRKIAIFR